MGIAIQVDNSEICVLGDMLERLPSTAQSTIAKMKPKEHWRREEKHEAYQDIRCYLMENCQWCHPPEAKLICLVHGYECPCFPLSKRALPSSDDEPSTSDLQPRRHLQVDAAGITCKSCSCAGLQTRESHESELPHAIWLSERVALAE